MTIVWSRVSEQSKTELFAAKSVMGGFPAEATNIVPPRERKMVGPEGEGGKEGVLIQRLKGPEWSVGRGLSWGYYELHMAELALLWTLRDVT